MTEEYYQPREIYFNRDQVIWILSWLDMMIKGNWPVNPQGTGYTDAPMGNKSRNRHAPYETAAMVAAEVEIRLGRLGLDRYLVEDRYIDGITEEAIAHKLGIHSSEVYRKLNSALWYVSGFRRKKMSYSDWKKQGRYRANNGVKSNQELVKKLSTDQNRLDK